MCGGSLRKRPDDDREIIKKRLEIYHKETEPLIEFFKEKNLLLEIDASNSVAETKTAAFKVLGVQI